MKSGYDKLGKYIREINERNTEDNQENLLGVSTQKVFIESIANTVGTDFRTYKKIKRRQFAYVPDTSRRGDKIGIALLDHLDKGLISQAYIVFEVIDFDKLLPEYLMMWFRRPEFDRYARYMSYGSVREIFDWEDLCNVELPIPSLIKQNEIVKEYNTIIRRIEVNTRLIQKLEETAQAIYKQWFVDFEFPDENGNPYKSSGGAMVESIFGEIPSTWKVDLYQTAMIFNTGKLNSNAAVENGKYPFFTCSSETLKTNTYSFDTEAVILAGNNASAIYPLKIFKGKFDAYQRTYVITPKSKVVSNKQIYFALKGELKNFKGTSSGTATKFLTLKILQNLKLVIPNKQVNKRFEDYINVLFDHLHRKRVENELLCKFYDVVLSKMTKETIL